MRDRLIEAWRTRPRLIVGCALGALALVSLGAFGLNGPRHLASAAGGPGLDIAVVAPVEPEVQPGDRMEVGALVDGFDTAALSKNTDQPSVSDVDDYYAEQPAYVGDNYEAPVPEPRYDARQEPRPAARDDDWRTVQGRGDRLGLGFDGARPESGAERGVRRSESQARAQTYRPNPTGDPGATFY